MVNENNILHIESDILNFNSASWETFISESGYDIVKSSNAGELYIVVRAGDDFFEVICSCLPLTSPLYPHVRKFLSHKLNQEVMETLFYDAIQLPQKNLYICQIQRLKKYFDGGFELIPTSHIYEEEGLEPGFPLWSFNNQHEEFLCSMSVYQNIIKFVFSKRDFTPKYTTDRDGGWIVYTHEQHVIGLKKFSTIYEQQFFLLELLEKEDIKTDFAKSDICYINLPINYIGNIWINTSICEFFSQLNIKDLGTIYSTYEEGADQTEDNWITSYDHGGTRGAWDERGWVYPTDYHPGVMKRTYYNSYLIWKYIKSPKDQKQLKCRLNY